MNEIKGTVAENATVDKIKQEIAKYIQDEISDLSCPKYKAVKIAQHILKETAKDILQIIDGFDVEDNLYYLKKSIKEKYGV